MVREVLEEFGFTVVTAAGGAEAVTARAGYGRGLTWLRPGDPGEAA